MERAHPAAARRDLGEWSPTPKWGGAVSVRDVVGRLADAKHQIVRIKSVGDSAAGTVAEAGALVNRVLDGVQDSKLADAITVQAKAVTDEFAGVLGLNAAIDDAIRRYQAIGAGGR